MQIRIRNDTVIIDGYVNAIERKSKTLFSRIGEFVERICKGAFKRAIERNNNIRLLLNHDWNRDLGGTSDGNLVLTEDAIGLKAHAEIRDAEVAEKARNGELVGWSFGFVDVDVDTHDENGMPTRDVRDLDLYEVSLLDRTKEPAYDGTLVTVRDNEKPLNHGEAMVADEIEIREEKEDISEEIPEKQPDKVDKDIDYTAYEKMIAEMREGYNE